jgi:hypothetical protein
MEDARLAVETGVDGVDVVIGTSSFLMEHSHGKDMAYMCVYSPKCRSLIRTLALCPANSPPWRTFDLCLNSID